MTVIALFLIFAMLAVLWFDIRHYLIPNWLTGALLVLYPLAVWMAPTPVDWQSGLMAFGLVFAVGYFVFAMKWMGGGDIKLITVCSLWVGLRYLPDFILLFAVLGGVFSLGLWVIRKILPHVPHPFPKPLPRLLREGEPVPYGVAIALGFLLIMKMGEVPAIALP